ncbi:MAG: ABC transporter permease [Clostridia bacterium]|jgi:ABC-2 type transport system permease protein|nr:ABC transporter permease [Clostridiaceae bacterium]
MWAVYRKELNSYFHSPIAYVLIGFFVLLTAIFFYPYVMALYGDFTPVLSTMGFILLFIVPILTMRILAEDRKNGTEVLLLTSPTSLPKIILGKFFAAYTVFFVMTAITFVFPIILSFYGGPITPQVVGAYFGFLLLGAAFIAFGVFSSSLTENQIIAAVIGFVGLLIMWLADALAPVVGGFLGKVLGWLSLLTRYNDFYNGILGLGPVVYYLSFTGVFIFLTVRVIERRRWSQG